MIYETKNKEYCLIDKINSTVFLKNICILQRKMHWKVAVIVCGMDMINGSSLEEWMTNIERRLPDVDTTS